MWMCKLSLIRRIYFLILKNEILKIVHFFLFPQNNFIGKDLFFLSYSGDMLTGLQEILPHLETLSSQNNKFSWRLNFLSAAWAHCSLDSTRLTSSPSCYAFYQRWDRQKITPEVPLLVQKEMIQVPWPIIKVEVGREVKYFMNKI